MNTTRSAWLLALTLAAFGTSACDEHKVSGQEPAAPAPAAATIAQPTDAALRARATSRMECLAKDDWVGAYDYTAEEERKLVKLQDYLVKKDSHRYREPKVQEILLNDGKHGYVRVTALWTPTDPRLQKVKLEPGQSLTQEVELYQSWMWSGAEWMYVRGQRPDEFFADHPALLRKSPPPSEKVSSANTEASAPTPK